ncbi:hypothetical protein Lal_00037955 [Lupinus albus]|nr:hypothetical protein Lal_00037955 [Lupinus albus]
MHAEISSFESREALISNESDDYVDYRGRKADPRKHGGVRAAGLACRLSNLSWTSNTKMSRIRTEFHI